MAPTGRFGVAVALVVAATFVGLGLAGGSGDPVHGALLWQSNACGTCHTFKRAGSTGTAGPNIDRWLVPHAIRSHLPRETFAFSRVYWGGRGMPPYGTGLPAQDVEDLVSFVLGRPFTAPADSPPRAPNLDPPPALVTAAPKTVAGWVRTKKLKGKAAGGASLFAQVGCLSCHTYLGAGKRNLGAKDLSKIGRSRRTQRGFERYVARPYASGNTSMPSYADLGTGQLQRLAAFLAASR